MEVNWLKSWGEGSSRVTIHWAEAHAPYLLKKKKSPVTREDKNIIRRRWKGIGVTHTGSINI